jgi:predicted PurR-regulated permease PerM
VTMDAPTPAAEDRTRRQLIVLAVFGGIFFVLLSAASGALGPFIVALVIAYLMAPVVGALQRRGVPRWLGILLIFLVMAVVAVAALSYLIPRIVSNIAALEAAGRQMLTNLPAWLASVGAPQEIVDAAKNAVEAALAAADGAAAGGLIGPALKILFGLAGTLVSFIFAPFFIFYVLNDANSVVSSFDRRIPTAWRADVWAMLMISDNAARQWLKATVLQGLVMGALSGVSMVVLGLIFGQAFLNATLLLMVISFFSEFIPIIGPLIPLVVATLVGATIGPVAAGAAFIVFAILQQIEANIVAPRIEGKALALHPALVLAVLILGLEIAGLVGALFATLFTSILLISGQYAFRRASGLIDPPPPPRPAPEPEPLDQGSVPGIPRRAG